MSYEKVRFFIVQNNIINKTKIILITLLVFEVFNN